MEDDSAAPDEVAASGEHADGRHAAGDGSLERRVLGPERVLDPKPGRHGIRHLVEVVVPLRLGDGSDAHVRVRVDDPRRNELAVSIDHDSARRRGRSVPCADSGELAVTHQDVARSEPVAGCRHHGRVLYQDRHGLPSLGGFDRHSRPRLGGREGVRGGERGGGGPSPGRVRAFGLARSRADGEGGQGGGERGGCERLCALDESI